MKVPFSTQWLTLDNRVDFIERGSDTPVYPFFDRGVLVWGTVAKGTTTYSLGVFNGNGVDVEGTKGDIDDHKDVAARLFLQPFRNSRSRGLKGLYLVGQGTYALTSAPTRRFETRGLMAANYESLLWRWRTEQVIGSNVRNIDQIAGEIDSRTRIGAEATLHPGPVLGERRVGPGRVRAGSRSTTTSGSARSGSSTIRSSRATARSETPRSGSATS